MLVDDVLRNRSPSGAFVSALTIGIKNTFHDLGRMPRRYFNQLQGRQPGGGEFWAGNW